jgi:hypothetical protein
MYLSGNTNEENDEKNCYLTIKTVNDYFDNYLKPRFFDNCVILNSINELNEQNIQNIYVIINNKYLKTIVVKESSLSYKI